MFGSREFPKIHDRTSILSFIRDQLDSTGRLADSACVLPDEESPDPGNIRWMAGAQDGAMGHHADLDGGGDADATARRIAQRIVDACTKPRRPQLAALYQDLISEHVLAIIDPVIRSLAQLSPSTVDVAAIGSWLASESPDRGPVKVGIALLGITGAPDGMILHQLGAHEEFTLYAAVAFTNSREHPESDLFELAQRVDGWGRIHCVERLRHTTDPTIARWILLEGFRNSVMNEYLAFIAATTGDLARALGEPIADPQLLTAASEIIDALITGGPAENIDDYPDAPVVLHRWLDHMEGNDGTLGEFLTVHAIMRFCARGDWDLRLTREIWTVADRESIGSSANALLDRPHWRAATHVGLESDDPQIFWQAERAARILGIDPFEQLLRRIDADPLDGPWFQAWQGADRPRAEILVDRAARLLDLESIATGPSTAIGLGPQFKAHSALGWTLQGLREHRGLGSNLISVAMNSPSIQNRNAALNVLAATGPDQWSSQQHDELSAMATTDPDDRVRQRAANLLAGNMDVW